MQNKVREFSYTVKCYDKKMPTYSRILNTESEMGEMTKEYLKNSRYGTQEFSMCDEFKMEYGDVLYSLLCLANELDIDANECLDMAIEKYKDRIAKHNTMGSEK